MLDWLRYQIESRLDRRKRIRRQQRDCVAGRHDFPLIPSRVHNRIDYFQCRNCPCTLMLDSQRDFDEWLRNL